ncbi:uncharacterized protein LOC124253300 [Haliotis rubra]|uniref:uncharacterized protein LOC124253300 n=1 Tax=Haliotis rubra TaxID=36100 RepID=UPI001EE62C75|nr:uncharacterized protein LOC124253300 [Haliotis rubra]
MDSNTQYQYGSMDTGETDSKKQKMDANTWSTAGSYPVPPPYPYATQNTNTNTNTNTGYTAPTTTSWSTGYGGAQQQTGADSYGWGSYAGYGQGWGTGQTGTNSWTGTTTGQDQNTGYGVDPNQYSQSSYSGGWGQGYNYSTSTGVDSNYGYGDSSSYYRGNWRGGQQSKPTGYSQRGGYSQNQGYGTNYGQTASGGTTFGNNETAPPQTGNANIQKPFGNGNSVQEPAPAAPVPAVSQVTENAPSQQAAEDTAPVSNEGKTLLGTPATRPNHGYSGPAPDMMGMPFGNQKHFPGMRGGYFGQGPFGGFRFGDGPRPRGGFGGGGGFDWYRGRGGGPGPHRGMGMGMGMQKRRWERPHPSEKDKTPIPEKLEKMIKYIKLQNSITVDVINFIDHSVETCKHGLRIDYRNDVKVRADGGDKMSGRLYLSSVFLARSIGYKKREVKEDCYQQAVEILTNKTVEEIMALKDVGPEATEKQILEDYEKKKIEVLAESMKLNEGITLRSREEKLLELVEYLKSGKKSPHDVIVELDDAFINSGCGLSREYSDEEVALPGGEVWYRGRFIINDTLIAGASGKSKEIAKQITYERSMNILRRVPLFVILEGSTLDELDPKLPSSPAFHALGNNHIPLPDDRTEEKLAYLISDAMDISRATPLSVELDNTAREYGLTVTNVYKRGPSDHTRSSMSCEVYLDNIFVADGEGFRRLEAEETAYKNTLKALCTSSSDVLFADSKRLVHSELMNMPLVSEVWIKGFYKMMHWSNWSKVRNLKKAILVKGDPDYTEMKRPNKDIILFENQKSGFDRFGRAYDILQLSATNNFMLLQGKTTNYGDLYRCQLFLQGELMSEAVSMHNLDATNRASVKLLFKLYLTQTTIKIVPLDQPSIWHTFESIKALADKMKAESGDTGTDDIVYVDDYVPKQPEKDELVPKEEEAKGSAVGNSDAPSSENNDTSIGGSDSTSAVADAAQNEANEGEKAPGDAAPAPPDAPDNDTDKGADGNPAPPPTIPVNKWVKVILDKMIEEYASTESMDELIFGPGLPENETKHVKVMVASLKQYFYCKKTKEGG